jgi:pyruvate kinase
MSAHAEHGDFDPAVHVGTKIVATIGPATASEAALARLFDAGVNVVRINFSHGARAEHDGLVAAVRAAAGRPRAGSRRAGPVALLGDLCGPKIRLRELEAEEIDIEAGATLRLAGDVEVGSAERVGLNHPEILDDIQPGHRVLIDDGLLRFRAVEQSRRAGSDVVCTCEVGGVLRARKGVNLPDTELRLECLTAKDFDDARWAMDSGFDYLALSFVRRADDMHRLRRLVRDHGACCHLVSKIEMPQAVRDIEAIIDASDAVLIARGDLGVEMDVALVPRIQKTVIAACRRAGKPAIVATHMLQSMIAAPTPTRAEVSDVANAIVDGADAVMLSGETAVGKFPTEAVELMRRIAVDTERYDQDHPVSGVLRCVKERHTDVSAAVADSMNGIVTRLSPGAIVVWTEEGTLARLVSRYRPDTPIIACVPSEHVRRRLALYYGVVAYQADRPVEATERLTAVDQVLVREGWAKPGDLVVVGVGPHSLDEVGTGVIAIRIVGTNG